MFSNFNDSLQRLKKLTKITTQGEYLEFVLSRKLKKNSIWKECQGLVVFNTKRDRSVAGLTKNVCWTAILGLKAIMAFVSHRKESVLLNMHVI